MLWTRVRHAGLFATLVGSALLASACLPAPGPQGPSGVPAPNGSVPSSSAPGGSPEAPASPAAKAEDAAIAAFATKVATGKLSYHIAFSGDVRLSVNRLPISGAMDVSGNDFSTSWTYDFEPDYPGLGKVRIQVRGIDSHAWIKRGSAGWATVKTYGVGQSYVPFKTVETPRDVKYLGPVKIGGRTYYKVAVNDALLMHPNTIPYQIQREEVQATTLEVLVDEAGAPRSGTWELRGQARIGSGNGQLQHVVYELTLTFSKVGGKISIKRP